MLLGELIQTELSFDKIIIWLFIINFCTIQETIDKSFQQGYLPQTNPWYLICIFYKIKLLEDGVEIPLGISLGRFIDVSWLIIVLYLAGSIDTGILKINNFLCDLSPRHNTINIFYLFFISKTSQLKIKFFNPYFSHLSPFIYSMQILDAYSVLFETVF